jgi:hypothetical protein
MPSASLRADGFAVTFRIRKTSIDTLGVRITRLDAGHCPRSAMRAGAYSRALGAGEAKERRKQPRRNARAKDERRKPGAAQPARAVALRVGLSLTGLVLLALRASLRCAFPAPRKPSAYIHVRPLDVYVSPSLSLRAALRGSLRAFYASRSQGKSRNPRRIEYDIATRMLRPGEKPYSSVCSRRGHSQLSLVDVAGVVCGNQRVWVKAGCVA